MKDDGEPHVVVERARPAGVELLVTICRKRSDFDHLLAIVQRLDGVYCSVGAHSHKAEHKGQDKPEHLVGLATQDKVVSIGETGLDYYYECSPREYECSPREQQPQNFPAHIEAAKRTGLPVIVHSRDSGEHLIAIPEVEYEREPFASVIHCFTTGPSRA